MFFISRARFDEMLREKNYQIGDRDRRIGELEAERRMLWDKLCLLGIGAPFFGDTLNPSHLGASSEAAAARSPQGEASESAVNAEVKSEAVVPRSGLTSAIGSHRPSQIMRRMDRLAEARWLRKIHPAKAAERQRDEYCQDYPGPSFGK